MSGNPYQLDPIYSPFFGELGVTAAMAFSAFGAAYGTAKSGTAIAGISPVRSDLVMKSIIPVIMASIVAIYGLVLAALISDAVHPAPDYDLFLSFIHLGAGLTVGLSGAAAGWAIGIVGDSCVRACAIEPKLYVGMILVLIFAEVLGLYGLIIGLIMATKQG